MKLKVLVLVLMLSLGVSGSLKADVALPPPTTVQTNVLQTSHNQQVNNGWRGTSPVTFNSNGQATLHVQKPMYGSSNGQTALKTNPVRVTGQYGEVVQGKVSTQTQLPKTSTMSKTGAGLMGTAIVGGAMHSEGEIIGRMVANGDYKGAAQAAVRGVLETLKGMGNFVTGGMITGVESAVNGYNSEKQKGRAGSMASAVEQAAQAKAEAAQEIYQQISQNEKEKIIAQAIKNGGYIYQLRASVDGIKDFDLPIFDDGKNIDGAYAFVIKEMGNYYSFSGNEKLFGILQSLGAKSVVVVNFYKKTVKDLQEMPLTQAEQPKIEDFMLTEKEIANILAPLLQQMLDNQKANHTELINTLANLGAIPANTPQNTSVIGTAADNTFVSAPYTPTGSQTAQQTSVTVNKDGSLTTSYIPRPDLGAGSGQAPFRSPIGGKVGGANKTGSGKRDGDKDVDVEIGGSSDDKKEQQEICTPEMQEKLLCLNAGSDDYEDLVIPTEEINVKFDKRDYFSTSGSCPKPVSFGALGHAWQISYEPTCKVATTIRPILELLGMLAAMGIAYGAVREL